MKKPPSQRQERAANASGPEALRLWVARWRDHWQAAYLGWIQEGWPNDLILLATPHDDDADSPPSCFEPLPRVQRGSITRQVPPLRGNFDKPARAGMFYVIATKARGRMQGTFVGMLPIRTTGTFPTVVVSVPREPGATDPEITIRPFRT